MTVEMVTTDGVLALDGGATGRSFSDEPTILHSIRYRLLTLAPATVVHIGHGDSTTIGDETEPVLGRISELGLT